MHGKPKMYKLHLNNENVIFFTHLKLWRINIKGGHCLFYTVSCLCCKLLITFLLKIKLQ